MSKSCFLNKCTDEAIFSVFSPGKVFTAAKTTKKAHCLEPNNHNIKHLVKVIPKTQYTELINHINTSLESVKKIQLDLFTLSTP